MDTFNAALFRAAVNKRAGESAPGIRQDREKMREERWRRGHMFFMERMDQDSRQKRAYSQVCQMRAEPSGKRMLDRQLEMMKARHPNSGPIVQSYSRHAVNHHHNKPYDWAP